MELLYRFNICVIALFILIQNAYADDEEFARENRHFNKHFAVHHSIDLGHKVINSDLKISPFGIDHSKQVFITNNERPNFQQFHDANQNQQLIDQRHDNSKLSFVEQTSGSFSTKFQSSVDQRNLRFKRLAALGYMDHIDPTGKFGSDPERSK